jgi:AcrR family transcriptional regulator
MDHGPKPSPRRSLKGDKRERTRRKLIEAAIEVVREKGYERTTIADVANRAGMTSGAIYGNFKNREELFLAIARLRSAPIVPDFPQNSSFVEKMRILADAVIAEVPNRTASAIGALSFRTYALKNEWLYSQLQAMTADAYRQGEAWLVALAADSQEELPMPPDILIRVLYATTEGLLLNRIMTPEHVPDAVFHAAFASIASGPASTKTSELV